MITSQVRITYIFNYRHTRIQNVFFFYDTYFRTGLRAWALVIKIDINDKRIDVNDNARPEQDWNPEPQSVEASVRCTIVSWLLSSAKNAAPPTILRLMNYIEAT